MPLLDLENSYQPGDEKYWLAFSKIGQIGIVRLKRLIDHFGNLSLAWVAPASELRQAGLGVKTVEHLVASRPQINPTRELERLHDANITLLAYGAPGYPYRLSEIDRPPPVLYLRGALTDADTLALAVVGTRNVTSYGKQVTKMFVTALVEKEITVVSGLARGVDTIAHQTALETKGRTLAVLACGVDVVYPPENRQIVERILDGNGAVISELPPGTQPDKDNFPPRNRIISGLSLGTLIVESAEKGGSLITATYANEQGREIFAIPGSIFSERSAGVNRLIAEGRAQLVINPTDIFQVLFPGTATRVVPTHAILEQAEDDTERKILQALSEELLPLHTDDLCEKTELPVEVLTSSLMMLQLRGLVIEAGNQSFALNYGG